MPPQSRKENIDMVKHPMVRLVDDDDLFRTSQAMLLQVNGFSVATLSYEE